jgi:ribosomal protein L21E
MANFKSGDSVQITAREQLNSDIKSGLYYNHYGNLTGTILKVYSNDEVSVLVDRETLTKEMRERHEQNEKAMKQKWLDGLSDEARNRLTTAEKQFGLNYALLVHASDLSISTVKRISQADLDAAEEAALKARTK